MRGRTPRPLTIPPADLGVLRRIARSRTRPLFAVQRARILIGLAEGERIAPLAARTQVDPATAWRVARRYERAGLTSVTTLGLPRCGASAVTAARLKSSQANA